MPDTQLNNPLHGVRLDDMLEQLEDHYGWDGLAERIPVNCFKSNPSFKSSLKFLRRTDWARAKLESLYLNTFSNSASQSKSRPKPGSKSGSKPATKSKPVANSTSESPPENPWGKFNR